MRIVRLSSGGVRHVRTEAGEAFFHKPIGAPITEAEYQDLLRQRREAQKLHPKGHPRRLEAERAVRQARKQREEPGHAGLAGQREKRLADIDAWVRAMPLHDLEYSVQEQEIRHYEPDEQAAIRRELRRREDEAEAAKRERSSAPDAEVRALIAKHNGQLQLRGAHSDYRVQALDVNGAPLDIVHENNAADEDASTAKFRNVKDMFGFIREHPGTAFVRPDYDSGDPYVSTRVERFAVIRSNGQKEYYERGTGKQVDSGVTPIAPKSKPETVGEQVGRTPGYQQLLDNRREARAKYPAGHPERVKAEQAVRRARREREKSPPETASDYKAPVPEVKPIVPESTGPEPLDFEDLNLNGKSAWRAITSNGRYLIEKRGQGDYTVTALNMRVIDAGGTPEKAVQVAEGLTRLSDAFDAAEEFERSGTFFGTGAEKTAWQSDPGYQQLENGYEVTPYGVRGTNGTAWTLSFHPTAEANATRWFATRREAEEFLQSKPQTYRYDPYWRRNGKAGPTTPTESGHFAIKRVVNGQSTFGGQMTREATDRVYFGNTGHPVDDIPIAFTDPNAASHQAEQAAANRMRSQMKHQYGYAPELVEEVHIAIAPKIEVTGEESANIAGVNVVRGTIGSDVTSSISLHQNTFPTINSDPQNPAEVLHKCQSTRHWVPTDAKWSLADVVGAHETGHGAAYRTFGTAAKGLPTGSEFWESFVDILRDEKRRKIGTGLAYEGKLTLPTILKEGASESDKAEALESWAVRNKVVLSTAVSKYGSKNLRELMAEMWCEYTLNSNPRPAAKFYGDYVTQFTRQRTRKAGVI